MRNKPAHISDAELLQSIDGELPNGRREEIDAHTAGCRTCSARKAKIESTLSNFVNDYIGDMGEKTGGETELLSAERSRVKLKTALDQVAARTPPRSWAVAGIGAALALTTILIVEFGISTLHAAPRPDTRLTPGATRMVSLNDICSVPASVPYRSLPASLAHQVFKEYGIRNPAPRSFEVDYLITPALGGSDDIQNLWPQPYSSGVWNAHVKDALEDHLRRLVCDGQVDLSTAQHDISVDWIAAYKKYFRTDAPLAIHSRFSQDAPWE